MSNIVTFPRMSATDPGDPVLEGLRDIADLFVPLGLKLRDSAVSEEDKAMALALMLQAAHSVMATTRLYIDALTARDLERAG